MKYLLIFVLIGLHFIIADPFAPKADKPGNPNNDADITLAITFLDNVIVPDKESVGLPPYGGAKIFQTSKPGELGSDLYMVRTFTEENLEKVVEFYRQQVPDSWDYKEFYGIHYLWTGDEMDAMMAKVPSVQISSGDDFKNIWPEANTVVVIYYE